eukprot:gene13040-8886_t
MHYHINLSANSVRTLILIYYTTTSQTHHTPTISNLSSTLHKLSNEPPLTINITYKRTQHKQLSTHCPSVYHNQNLQSINTPLVAYPHNILNQTRVATHAQCEHINLKPNVNPSHPSATATISLNTHVSSETNTQPQTNKQYPTELNKQMTLTTYTEQHTQYLHYAAYSTHPSKLYCTYYTEAAHKTTISAARRIGTDKDNLNVKAQIMRLNTHINANQAKQYTAFPNTSYTIRRNHGHNRPKQTHSDSNVTPLNQHTINLDTTYSSNITTCRHSKVLPVPQVITQRNHNQDQSSVIIKYLIAPKAQLSVYKSMPANLTTNHSPKLWQSPVHTKHPHKTITPKDTPIPPYKPPNTSKFCSKIESFNPKYTGNKKHQHLGLNLYSGKHSHQCIISTLQKPGTSRQIIMPTKHTTLNPNSTDGTRLQHPKPLKSNNQKTRKQTNSVSTKSPIPINLPHTHST